MTGVFKLVELFLGDVLSLLLLMSPKTEVFTLVKLWPGDGLCSDIAVYTDTDISVFIYYSQRSTP